MRIRTLLATLLILFCGIPAATSDGSGWGEIVPSETCRGLWIVPITYDGDPDKILHMVLDTGAGSTSVDPDALERIVGRRVRAGKKVRLKNGIAGPLRIKRVKVQSHEMDHLSRALGQEIDGILGFPVFKDLLLTLDYPAEEIRIRAGGLAEVDDRTIFKDLGKVRPYLAIEVDGTRVPVLLDSGSAGGLRFREEDRFDWEASPRGTSGSVGYSSIRLVKEGRARDRLQFGTLIIERPVVNVVEHGVRLAGWKILRRFAWTFDQRNRRIRLVADSEGPILMEPVRGIGLMLRPNEEGFEVAEVMPGTPAERVGVLKGDLIFAVDGVPVHERGCQRIYGDDRVDSHVLSLRRGDNSIEISVPVEVLVP